MKGLEGLFGGKFGLCKDLESSSGVIFGTCWGTCEISETSVGLNKFPKRFRELTRTFAPFCSELCFGGVGSNLRGRTCSDSLGELVRIVFVAGQRSLVREIQVSETIMRKLCFYLDRWVDQWRHFGSRFVSFAYWRACLLLSRISVRLRNIAKEALM